MFFSCLHFHGFHLAFFFEKTVQTKLIATKVWNIMSGTDLDIASLSQNWSSEALESSRSKPQPLPCTGQDRTGQDRTGQDRTGQDRTGQDRTGQDRTGQDRTGQDSFDSRTALAILRGEMSAGWRCTSERYQIRHTGSLRWLGSFLHRGSTFFLEFQTSMLSSSPRIAKCNGADRHQPGSHYVRPAFGNMWHIFRQIIWKHNVS